MSDRQGPVNHAEPRQALRSLIEQGEGASASATMLRLMWLRQDYPAAAVVTEAIHLNETTIAVRATISLPQGGSGSGLAASIVEDFSEWAAAVERTETNAIARALDTLGYMLERANATAATPAVQQTPSQVSPQPQPHVPQQPRPQPQPSPQQAPSQARPQAQAQPSAPVASPQAQQPPRSMTPPSRPTAVPRNDEAAPPVINALRRAQTRPQSAPQGTPPPQGPAEPPRDDDAPLPEYSWTGFWNTARGFGLDARKVEEILGRPANQSSPKEAVEALRAAGAWGAREDTE